MPAHFDVIVIGVGAMGSAACYHLARRGMRVLGLEQFDIPHTRGSAHGYSRLTRMAYYEHPDYVPLLRRAWQLWRELETEAGDGRAILHATGGLYLGPPGGELVARSRASAEQHGLPHEMLSRGDLRRRFPQFRVPEEYVALHEHNAGLILPERAISTHVDLAGRRGAEIHGHEPVVEWASSAAGVTVRTTRNTYHADQLVFTGGAWSDRLVRDLGIRLTVTRQPLGWVQPRRADLFGLGAFPAWGMDDGGGGLYYGFPLLPDGAGVKIAHHIPMEPTDPDTVDRTVRPEDEQTFRPVLTQHLPDADGPTLAVRICLYTNSPDGHFILDRHPAHERVLLACGFSGHGFKFASVMGEVIAGAVETGEIEPVARFLGMGRFGT